MDADGPWEVADKARVGPLVTQTHEQLVYAGYKTVSHPITHRSMDEPFKHTMFHSLNASIG